MPPPKSVVIIFDDGYENNYTLGYPVIKELGLKANIAVIFEHSINKSDNPDYVETISPRLTMEEIEEMQASGCIEIGSHTYAGHSPGESYQCREGYFMVEPAYNKSLGRQETEAEFFNRVEDDTFKAKELMRQRLGIDDPFFVYPYGRVGSAIESSIKKAGFNSAFIIGDAYAKSSVDLYKIPRFTMAPRISNEEFASIISGKGFLPPPEPVKPKEEKKEASEKKEG